MTKGPFLELAAIAKSFDDHVVLDQISLGVEEGETLALLGPSGSGKTTLLRVIAGFEAADGGAIRVDGVEVTGLPPAKRRFGMVFQHYALFPHLSVGENVAFGLASGASGGRSSADERRRQVAEALGLVDLAGFEERRIHQISGGQQQRVALARALAPGPRLLLLDEPLSNLDRTLRERTRGEIGATLSRVGITAVWVTHEQEEAFDVGDRVAVLHRGHLEQLDTPERLYVEPATRFVAGFVGRASAVAGFFRGEGAVALAGAEGEGLVWHGAAAEALEAGDRVELVFRPEALDLVPEGAAGALPVRVLARRYAGSQTFFTVEGPGGDPLEVIAPADAAATGERRGVAPRPGAPLPRIFKSGTGTAFSRVSKPGTG